MHPTNPPTLNQMLRDAACIELGIVPLNHNIHDGIKQRLDAMPPDEARKMKRKFRKLWRKIAKKQCRSESVGLGDPDATNSQRRYRKSLVRGEIERNFVRPTLERLKGNTDETSP
jgi:hypothetical protein